jgi:hypothetical protein
MRFISMHKVDALSERAAPPEKKTLDGMGKLIGEMIASGAFVNGDGLVQSARRVKLRFAGGERTIIQGPFKGTHEIIAGFTLIKVKEMDEAIAWATRLAEITGREEIEVGPATEAWDLGIGEKPADAPLRCLLLEKGEGGPLEPQVKAAVARLTDEMREAGVWLAAERLQSSASGRRVQYARGKRTVVDGPFAEAKELIGGFIILRADRIDDLLPWLDRFADVFHSDEVELDLYALVD